MAITITTGRVKLVVMFVMQFDFFQVRDAKMS